MAGERGGGLAGASGGAGVSGLRPEEARLRPLGQSEGTGRDRRAGGRAGGRTRPLGDCAVRARPAWPQVPLDEAAPRAPTGECPRWPGP